MHRKYFPNLLTVGCWNIQGLYQKVNGVRLCKLEEESCSNIITKFDLLCLQETHTSQLQKFNLQNYVSIPHCRKMRRNNRYFGGMLLLIKTTIKSIIRDQAVTRIPSCSLIMYKPNR